MNGIYRTRFFKMCNKSPQRTKAGDQKRESRKSVMKDQLEILNMKDQIDEIIE